MTNIDIYCIEASAIIEKIKEFLADTKLYKCNFQKGNGAKSKSLNAVVLFEEEDSYISSYDRFIKIKKNYKDPIAIVLTKNPDIFNVVQWMRQGVVDCLLIADFGQSDLVNSIEGSIDFINHSTGSSETDQNNNLPQIQLPQNVDWSVIPDNSDLDMSLVMISVDFKKDSIGKYSADSKKEIYQKIELEISNMLKMFGGIMWYWTNNFGVAAFHFGDKVNCSALAAITFYYKFFLLCLEKLKLEELLDFKLSIHNGTGIFNKNDTGQITSDLINSLAHLSFQYTDSGALSITQDVYDQLSPRLKPSFSHKGEFENREIYSFTV